MSNAGCCPDLGVSRPMDFGKLVGSAQIYLERKGHVPTYRNPQPRIEPSLMRPHTIPLAAPLPLPETQLNTDVDNEPDHGQTHAWPPVDPTQ